MAISRGYVYVIGNEAHGLYKIGFSRVDPFNRLEVVQANCPLELKMIKFFLVKNARLVEQRLHHHFRYECLRLNSKLTEWFKLDAKKLKQVEKTIPPDEIIDNPNPKLRPAPVPTPLPELRSPTESKSYCKATEFKKATGYS